MVNSNFFGTNFKFGIRIPQNHSEKLLEYLNSRAQKILK
jgi:hypothetical protein